MYSNIPPSKYPDNSDNGTHLNRFWLFYWIHKKSGDRWTPCQSWYLLNQVDYLVLSTFFYQKEKQRKCVCDVHLKIFFRVNACEKLPRWFLSCKMTIDRGRARYVVVLQLVLSEPPANLILTVWPKTSQIPWLPSKRFWETLPGAIENFFVPKIVADTGALDKPWVATHRPPNEIY